MAGETFAHFADGEKSEQFDIDAIRMEFNYCSSALHVLTEYAISEDAGQFPKGLCEMLSLILRMHDNAGEKFGQFALQFSSRHTEIHNKYHIQTENTDTTEDEEYLSDIKREVNDISFEMANCMSAIHVLIGYCDFHGGIEGVGGTLLIAHEKLKETHDRLDRLFWSRQTGLENQEEVV